MSKYMSKFPVICKETYTNISNKTIIKDIIYWALQLDHKDMKNTYCIYVDNTGIRKDYLGNFRHEHFISIAEWREKQIKDILDE